ncbi:hypothetical protein H0A36_08500 [Endozoicomonas sp. SM1973]|uniref:DNA alkylation repair enzyme n=1 Tax=Spartinivicinus marinus TaxID=2994442 RepID=A0A853I836_9GAMM|nr:hypothetical protein [Spartinivicinus marinus]MCX4027228.1 hypothetical protein [Spartinivicinus marinus]NYZ66051.1 hypothetical protein [Spartinivicinus marinus]
MKIEHELTRWDGKSKDDTTKIYETYHTKAEFAATIIKLMNNPSCQKGATWLLKAFLESNNKIDKKQIKSVYDSLHQLDDWESKLHILQSIPYMPIAKTECKKLERFLRVTLTDKNKFVRAWSYNGFYVLAKQYPAYAEEVKQFFEMAMKDEAASVKARIKNIMKKGF